MPRLLTALLVCLISAVVPVSAHIKLMVSDVPTKSPTTVVALSIRSLGDQKLVSRIRSITALADCVGPRSQYQTEIDSERGNRLVFKQSFPVGRTFAGYVNGKYVWTKDAKTGEVTAGDRQLAAMMRGHEFQMIAIAPLERFRDPIPAGYENFAGALCIKLRMTDELGKATYLFFHAESKLMAGLIISNVVNGENNSVRIVFNEWKPTGKVKLPF
jgi:hypothetical protein